MRLFEDALRSEKPILGICLGSQLLASVLGSRIESGSRKEIGWATVRLTGNANTDQLWVDLPRSFVGYHWHGDVFALPHDAVWLASSDLTPVQAFRYGTNAYGMLFHAEVTSNIIHSMVKTFADELQEAGLDGEVIITDMKNHLSGLQNIGNVMFQRWVSLLDTFA